MAFQCVLLTASCYCEHNSQERERERERIGGSGGRVWPVWGTDAGGFWEFWFGLLDFIPTDYEP